MKSIILSLLVILSISCSVQEDQKDDLNLSELELTGLEFGFNEEKVTINIDLYNQEQVSEFSNEIIEEIDELINGNKDIYYSFSLDINPKENKLVLSNFKQHYFDNQIKNKSTANNENINSDPEEDLMGSCSEGWDDEGNCHSSECVKEKVEEVLTEITENGDCRRVEVSRGFVNAKVCSQEC